MYICTYIHFPFQKKRLHVHRIREQSVHHKKEILSMGLVFSSVLSLLAFRVLNENFQCRASLPRLLPFPLSAYKESYTGHRTISDNINTCMHERQPRSHTTAFSLTQIQSTNRVDDKSLKFQSLVRSCMDSFF